MDNVCPITATRYSVKDLNLTVTKPWCPHEYSSESEDAMQWDLLYVPNYDGLHPQVGGYIQQYEGGFTFASVRGAGHAVPSFQPKRSEVLFYSFLKGVLPPAVSLWRLWDRGTTPSRSTTKENSNLTGYTNNKIPQHGNISATLRPFAIIYGAIYFFLCEYLWCYLDTVQTRLLSHFIHFYCHCF